MSGPVWVHDGKVQMTAVETVARVLHDEHAKYIEHTAPFERCPGRATELRIAAAIVKALGLAG